MIHLCTQICVNIRLLFKVIISQFHSKEPHNYFFPQIHKRTARLLYERDLIVKIQSLRNASLRTKQNMSLL
jgi:hypothetical protein